MHVQENLHTLYEHPFFAGGLAIFLLILTGCILVLLYHSPTEIPTALSALTPTPAISQVIGSAPPEVYFQTYQIPASLSIPVLPSSLSLYTLQTPFSEAAIGSFMQKLGITNPQSSSNGTVVGYNLTDTRKLGIATFTKATGAFSYQSYSDLIPAGYTQGQSPKTEAIEMLTQLGLSDPTITCPITYNRTTMPNLTYVECHRDWEKVGLPIYNILGLMNLSPTVSLASEQLGVPMINAPKDPFITNVSNYTSGYLRPNDFNTATFGIDASTGRIVSIDSSLRWIKNNTQINASSLLTPQQALAQFMAHKASFSLTLPAGNGVVNDAQVYPQNLASAEQATISGYTLAYLENAQPNAQQTLSPMYIVRGSALLQSGYSVNFMQALPAIIQTFAQTQPIQSVAGAATNASNTQPNLHMQTFQTAIPPEVAPITFTPTPVQPTPTPSTQYACEAAPAWAHVYTFNLPGVGSITVADNIINQYNPHEFELISSSAPNTTLATARDALFQIVQKQFDINVAKDLQSVTTQSLTSAAQVKNEFAAINQGLYKPPVAGAPTTGTCLYPISSTIAAPIYSCTKSVRLNPDFDITRIETNATNVANDIYTAIQQHTLFQIASQPNYFADDVLANLSGVFNFNTNQIPNTTATSTTTANKATTSCYISGISPALFLYPQSSENIQVQTGASLTYTDPPAFHNIWHVFAQQNGMLTQNGITRQELYYEYNPQTVSFPETGRGYMVKTNHVSSSTRTLAHSIDLNTQETTALLADIKHEQSRLTGEYTFIQVLPSEIVSQQLPLHITPAPGHLYRIFMLLTPLHTPHQVSAPVLPHIFRNGFTAVEVGAHVSEIL